MFIPPDNLVGDTVVESLSRSEHEVLKLMANGLSNREIANQLYKAEETVANSKPSIANLAFVQVGLAISGF
ncbi:helix-turn-helix transcriptional regulator [Chloroflexi bacterium TSY]|nr:helix-turn-helix transcriptional regulator [Chloroflexi bacterium TSY]